MTNEPKRVVRRVSVEFSDGSFFDVTHDLIERMNGVADGLETLDAAIRAARRLRSLEEK